MSSKIGIQAGILTKRIEAGRLNKAGTMFIGEKQDVTEDCLYAVSKHVLMNHDGNAVIGFRDGYKVTITVSKEF